MQFTDNEQFINREGYHACRSLCVEPILNGELYPYDLGEEVAGLLLALTHLDLEEEYLLGCDSDQRLVIYAQCLI